MRLSKKTVGDFVKDAHIAEFFMNLENVLIDYPPGEPEMKPDVIKETKILLKKKEEIKKNAVEQHRNQQELKKKQYDKISETNPEIFQRIQSQQQEIHALQHENESLQSQLRQLKELYSKTIRENMELKKK
jgi:hypothetical protein